MSEPKKEGYLIVAVADEEKRRLALQHKMCMTTINNAFFLPSISIPKDARIADIGTGTGVWLEEFQKNVSDPELKRFDGFDISAGQFPQTHAEGINFIVHDALQEFPEEYHGQYDLVHLRFLVVAFKGEQWVTATKNILQILKPGGLIQWEDLDMEQVTHKPEPTSPRLLQIVAESNGFVKLVGFNITPQVEILAAFRKLGMLDVQHLEFDSWEHPEANELAQKWAVNGFAVSTVPSLMRSGKVKTFEEAKGKETELREELEAIYATGVVPRLVLQVVVGRKPYE